MSDFRLFTETDLATVLCDHVGDFDDQATEKTITVDYLLAAVAKGSAVIEADECAIAVVRPEGWRPANGESVLWLLFVDAQCRGDGHGRRLVERLKHTHSHELPMILICHGERRIKFFEACGFVIKEDISAGTVMVAPRKSFGSN